MTVALSPIQKQNYQKVIDEVNGYLNNLAPPLQTKSHHYINALSKRDIVQTLTLLPYYLQDILSVSLDVCHQLALAQFYTCWYYHVQDDLLDAETETTMLLGGHLALLKMVGIYQALALNNSPYWQFMQNLLQQSAETYALEMEYRFDCLEDLTLADLTPFTLDFAAKRLSPFLLSTVAQCALCGLAPNSPKQQAIIKTINLFLTVRQIGDDACDWQKDLEVGQLNYASALLLSRFYAHYKDNFNLERLIGYQFSDEDFWQLLEQTSNNCYKQILDILSPYPNCTLQTHLIKPRMVVTKAAWQELYQKRETVRKLFGITA